MVHGIGTCTGNTNANPCMSWVHFQEESARIEGSIGRLNQSVHVLSSHGLKASSAHENLYFMYLFPGRDDSSGYWLQPSQIQPQQSSYS